MQNILSALEKVAEFSGRRFIADKAIQRIQTQRRPWRIRLDCHVHLLTESDYLLIASHVLRTGKLYSLQTLKVLERKALAHAGRIMVRTFN